MPKEHRTHKPRRRSTATWCKKFGDRVNFNKLKGFVQDMRQHLSRMANMIPDVRERRQLLAQAQARAAEYDRSCRVLPITTTVLLPPTRTWVSFAMSGSSQPIGEGLTQDTKSPVAKTSTSKGVFTLPAGLPSVPAICQVRSWSAVLTPA